MPPTGSALCPPVVDGQSELVEEQKKLLSTSVITDLSLVDNDRQLVATTLREVASVCRVAGLILNPPTQPIWVPKPPALEAPAPV